MFILSFSCSFSCEFSAGGSIGLSSSRLRSSALWGLAGSWIEDPKGISLLWGAWEDRSNQTTKRRPVNNFCLLPKTKNPIWICPLITKGWAFTTQISQFRTEYITSSNSLMSYPKRGGGGTLKNYSLGKRILLFRANHIIKTVMYRVH